MTRPQLLDSQTTAGLRRAASAAAATLGTKEEVNAERRAASDREYMRMAQDGAPPDAKCAPSRAPGHPVQQLAADDQRLHASQWSRLLPVGRVTLRRKAACTLVLLLESASSWLLLSRCTLCDMGASGAAETLSDEFGARAEGGGLGPWLLVRVSAITNAWIHEQCARWSPEVYETDDGLQVGPRVVCAPCPEAPLQPLDPSLRRRPTASWPWCRLHSCSCKSGTNL